MSLGWSVVLVVAIIVLPFVAAWLTLRELRGGAPDSESSAQ